MKTAILSDIHGNREALEAVLKDIDDKGGADRYWCLGDTVDYGPDPHWCLEKTRQLNALTILGNHDAAVCGKLDYRKEFSADFIEITGWTEAHLPEADKAYLAGLPLRIETTGFTLVHGSPRDPFWEYILDTTRAFQNLPFVNTPYCLVGHTHIKASFEFDESQVPNEAVPFSREMDKEYFKNGRFSSDLRPPEKDIVRLNRQRLIINPGAVGQQRAKDTRAAYAVYNDDDSVIELRRVHYNTSHTRQKMLDAGLPVWLADRLMAGT